MKYLFLSLFIFGAAHANTEAYFADSCSGNEIKISTPNGTSLFIKIDNLDPNEDAKLFINYRPAGEIEDLKSKSNSITHQYLIRARDIRDGNFSRFYQIPKAKWLWQVESRHSFYRIWDAEIKWVQKHAKKSGSTVTSFYRSPGKKSFFQLNSPGLCQWESKAEVSSKLYENNTTTFMNIVRENIQKWDKYQAQGFSLGFNRNHGGTLPIGALSSSSFGWFFKDWQNQMNAQEIINIERKYVLNKEESGVFITRMTYNRHEVTKYAWNSRSGYCGKYEAVSTGLLDVGVTSEDFIVLPKYIFPREEYMEKFLNIVRPAVSNCDDSIDLRPQVATDYIPSGNNGILYFYETNRSEK